VDKTSSLTQTPKTPSPQPTEVIELEPILIVAIDRCEDAERNCFCSPWSEAPGLEAVAEGRSVLREGHRGPAVEELQHELGVNEDGLFGPKTEAEVRSFQKKHGLTVDGIVGPETLEKMIDLKLAALEQDPRFLALPDDVQRSATDRLLTSTDTTEQRDVLMLVTSARFGSLAQETQRSILGLKESAWMAPIARVADARRGIE
jgi:hypothetical protein